MQLIIPILTRFYRTSLFLISQIELIILEILLTYLALPVQFDYMPARFPNHSVVSYQSDLRTVI